MPLNAEAEGFEPPGGLHLSGFQVGCVVSASVCPCTPFEHHLPCRASVRPPGLLPRVATQGQVSAARGEALLSQPIATNLATNAPTPVPPKAQDGVFVLRLLEATTGFEPV